MRVFVAAWFFPPATSSEGLVTYKLLRNSEIEYDVFSSTSLQWGYKAHTSLKEEKNIHCYTISTDSIDEWVEACILKFEELNKEYSYECIMTRSTPPESILVGKAIKQKHPGIKWIASFGDPVANNPYELKAYISDSATIDPLEKKKVLSALRQKEGVISDKWECANNKEIQLLFRLKDWEDYALKNADLIIAPSERQLKYILGSNTWLPKYFPIPHSYDSSFYCRSIDYAKNEKITFLYTGYSDQLRSLKPFVDAMVQLKRAHSPVLEKIQINVVGNTPRTLIDDVINSYLDDVFTFYDGVDYYKSLELMEKADWLLHVDAFFPELVPGGSIFFAGKLADYFGTKKPIFALTGKGSPASRMVELAGGVCDLQWDIDGICDHFEQIVLGSFIPEINDRYRECFDAKRIAHIFDDRVMELCMKKAYRSRSIFPSLSLSEEKKVLSICVPSFNAQKYLDRCIFSLVNHPMAAYEEVLVINDGSVDKTSEIAADYAKRYPGIVRVINKDNGGHGSTINCAIKEAKGLYFKNVDSDDWVDSKNLSRLIEGILKGNLTSDIISSDYDEIDLETGNNTPICAGSSIQYGKEYTFDSVNVKDCYFTIHSLTIKTEILKSMDIALQEHTFFVDCEYILFPIPYVHTFVFLKDKIYKYSRGNPEQSVDISNMVRRYDHHNRVIRRVIEYSNSVAMSSSQKHYYDETLHRLLYTHYLLSLFYDTDRERGFNRAADFDNFLKSARPDLYYWTDQNFRFVHVARVHHFSSKTKITLDNVTLEKRVLASNNVLIRGSKKIKRLYKKIKNI